MILRKSVHTVHFWFLSFKFIILDGEWFEERCTLVCTKSDHLSQDDKRAKPLCMMQIFQALHIDNSSPRSRADAIHTTECQSIEERSSFFIYVRLMHRSKIMVSFFY